MLLDAPVPAAATPGPAGRGAGEEDGETLRARGLIIGDDGRARPPWAAADPVLRDYYDHEWGRPVAGEAGMFERLSLEGLLAGLSWLLILRKRPAFREVFCGFDPDAVAALTEADVERFLLDRRLVRNRRKLAAVITNAQATVRLREDGGLVELISSFAPAHWDRPPTVADSAQRCPESVALAKELKSRGFKFVGPVSIFSLFEATGLIDNRVVGAAGLIGG